MGLSEGLGWGGSGCIWLSRGALCRHGQLVPLACVAAAQNIPEAAAKCHRCATSQCLTSPFISINPYKSFYVAGLAGMASPLQCCVLWSSLEVKEKIKSFWFLLLLRAAFAFSLIKLPLSHPMGCSGFFVWLIFFFSPTVLLRRRVMKQLGGHVGPPTTVCMCIEVWGFYIYVYIYTKTPKS